MHLQLIQQRRQFLRRIFVNKSLFTPSICRQIKILVVVEFRIKSSSVVFFAA